MAKNPAAEGVVADSPHVVTATGQIGGTPAVWDAVANPMEDGGWDGVDQNSGPADFTGRVTGDFESGPGRWEQT